MLPPQRLRRRQEEMIVEDARLQAVDAAKKKAISQHVDVEAFQALVSASHLRPTRGGLRILGATQGCKPGAPRHFRPDGSIAPSASDCAQTGSSISSRSGNGTSACSQAAALEEALRSGAHFGRAWRAAPAAADRLQLLLRGCEAGALPRLLRLELSSRMLEDILACLDSPLLQHQQAQTAAGTGEAASSLAAQVLQAAAAASGFAVAKAGLSLQGRQHLAQLVIQVLPGGSSLALPVDHWQA